MNKDYKTQLEQELNSLTSKKSDHLNLEQIVSISNKIGMEYVDAKKKADFYELLKPCKRAQAMEKYDDEKRSEAKIRRLAETDPEYIQFINDLVEAKSCCDKLKVRYESYKNLFEAKRSLLSYQKAEMKML